MDCVLPSVHNLKFLILRERGFFGYINNKLKITKWNVKTSSTNCIDTENKP